MSVTFRVAVRWLILLGYVGVTQASLLVNETEPKVYGRKAVLKMDLQNTFPEPIEAVRAVVFLMDNDGKVVGQQTRWILGGSKGKPSLASDAKTTFNFVIQSEKPFAKTKIIVTRIVLEGGKRGDLNKDVVITSETK